MTKTEFKNKIDLYLGQIEWNGSKIRATKDDLKYNVDRLYEKINSVIRFNMVTNIMISLNQVDEKGLSLVQHFSISFLFADYNTITLNEIFIISY